MNQFDILNTISSSLLCQHLLAFQATLSNDDLTGKAFKTLLNTIADALLAGEKPADLALRIAKFQRKKHQTLNPLTIEQAKAILVNIKKLRQLATKKNTIRGSRKLDRYRQDIGALYQAKASHRDIQTWLRREKRLKVSQTTIQRYLLEMKADGEIK